MNSDTLQVLDKLSFNIILTVFPEIFLEGEVWKRTFFNVIN